METRRGTTRSIASNSSARKNSHDGTHANRRRPTPSTALINSFSRLILGNYQSGRKQRTQKFVFFSRAEILRISRSRSLKKSIPTLTHARTNSSSRNQKVLKAKLSQKKKNKKVQKRQKKSRQVSAAAAAASCMSQITVLMSSSCVIACYPTFSPFSWSWRATVMISKWNRGRAVGRACVHVFNPGRTNR